jgi:hypothetical protein
LTNEASVEASPEEHAKLGSFLVLAIISEHTGKVVASANLTCGPAGGSHPHAAAACQQLSKVAGHIERIPEDPGPCPKISDPVILAAVGNWNGQPRYYYHSFPNRCVGVRKTGGVVFNL